MVTGPTRSSPEPEQGRTSQLASYKGTTSVYSWCPSSGGRLWAETDDTSWRVGPQPHLPKSLLGDTRVERRLAPERAEMVNAGPAPACHDETRRAVCPTAASNSVPGLSGSAQRRNPEMTQVRSQA